MIKTRLRNLLCYFLIVTIVLCNSAGVVRAYTQPDPFGSIKDFSFSSDGTVWNTEGDYSVNGLSIIFDTSYKYRINKQEYKDYMCCSDYTGDPIFFVNTSTNRTANAKDFCRHEWSGTDPDTGYDIQKYIFKDCFVANTTVVHGVEDENNPDYLIFDFTVFNEQARFLCSAVLGNECRNDIYFNEEAYRGIVLTRGTSLNGSGNNLPNPEAFPTNGEIYAISDTRGDLLNSLINIKNENISESHTLLEPFNAIAFCNLDSFGTCYWWTNDWAYGEPSINLADYDISIAEDEERYAEEFEYFKNNPNLYPDGLSICKVIIRDNITGADLTDDYSYFFGRQFSKGYASSSSMPHLLVFGENNRGDEKFQIKETVSFNWIDYYTFPTEYGYDDSRPLRYNIIVAEVAHEHIWDDNDWADVSDENVTQELFEGAENAEDLEFDSLGNTDTVRKQPCHLGCGAYNLEVVHTHKYGTPTFNWADDYSSCTATFVCVSNDDTQIVPCDVSSEVTLEPTEEEVGNRRYTAIVQTPYNGIEFRDLEGNPYKDTKNVEIPRLPHTHTPDDGNKEDEIPATCTQDGSYNWVVRCSVCGDIISSESHTIQRKNHNWGSTWNNISSETDIDALIEGAENKDIIEATWVNDDYHKLQVKYCQNSCECIRGNSNKAYELRVLRFEFKFEDDNDDDGNPDVTVDVYDDTDGGDTPIDEIPTTVEENPVVPSENPETDDPYVPYDATPVDDPEDNPYDYSHTETRNYKIPTTTIKVSTNSWQEFLNSITFNIFFKDTQDGTISYEFKNPNTWDRVKTISNLVTTQGTTYTYEQLKDITNWTEGDEFTLAKKDTEKYVAYAKVKLACGYVFYISSDGMIIDSVPPTISTSTDDEVILFSEEEVTITDNTKIDKVYVDGNEVTITMNEDGNKTVITIPNDNGEHTITATDKAGNSSEKTIKFGHSDFMATIEGYIKDVDGQPVSGATVELHSTPRTTTTDANGKFTFEGVEVDRHTLTAYADESKIYDMVLALTPTYVQTSLNEVSGSYTVSSNFEVNDEYLIVRVNADECASHTHGRIAKENIVPAGCIRAGGYNLVDYCPNCGCEYERSYEFDEALGHDWSGEWTDVSESTAELFEEAENAEELDYSNLGAYDTVKRLDCAREDNLCTSPKAYKLRVIAHSHTPGDAHKENEITSGCERHGSYDMVVRCTVCNDIISSVHTDLEALGHDWNGTWSVVDNPTKALFNNAENSDELDFDSLGTNDLVEKLDCNREDSLCTTPKKYRLRVNVHTHRPGEAVKENNIDPTCTRAGSYDSVVYCIDCNEELSRTPIGVDALGHIWLDEEEEWVLVENPTEELFENAENSDELDFSELKPNDKVYKRLCNRAQDAYDLMVGSHIHTPGDRVKENNIEPTCTEKGSHDEVVYCLDCNEELSREKIYTNALGHIWVDEEEEWVLVENPTRELFEGAENAADLDFDSLKAHDKVYKRLCNRAQDAYDLSVGLHIHTPADEVIENNVEPTCLTKGGYDKVIYCEDCGEELSRDKVKLDALGHINGEPVIENYVEPTHETEGGYDSVIYCSREKNGCNHSELSRQHLTLPMTDHVPGEPVIENLVEPKCVEKGSYDIVVYCTDCGEELIRYTVEIDALGHDMGAWYVTKESSYDEKGTERRDCQRTTCDYFEERDLDKLEKPKEPTTTEETPTTEATTEITTEVPTTEVTTEVPTTEVTTEVPTTEVTTEVPTTEVSTTEEESEEYTEEDTEDETPSTKTKKDSPKTGDTENPCAVLVMFVISGLLSVYFISRRKREE